MRIAWAWSGRPGLSCAGIRNDLVDDRLDATFTALADPTRRASWRGWPKRRHGERAGGSLRHDPSGISKHLKMLERCGLISESRAQFRPCTSSGKP